jgi:hypothetical protein
MDYSIDGIQKILKYSSYAVIAWALSWVIFFIMLPFMVKVFGKVRGGALNYAFSWITMPIIILGLEYFRRKIVSGEMGIVEVEGVVESHGDA